MFKEHTSDGCDRYPTYSSRLTLLSVVCQLCLSRAHKTYDCQIREALPQKISTCDHCGSGFHHTALCNNRRPQGPWPTVHNDPETRKKYDPEYKSHQAQHSAKRIADRVDGRNAAPKGAKLNFMLRVSAESNSPRAPETRASSEEQLDNAHRGRGRRHISRSARANQHSARVSLTLRNAQNKLLEHASEDYDADDEQSATSRERPQRRRKNAKGSPETEDDAPQQRPQGTATKNPLDTQHEPLASSTSANAGPAPTERRSHSLTQNRGRPKSPSRNRQNTSEKQIPDDYDAQHDNNCPCHECERACGWVTEYHQTRSSDVDAHSSHDQSSEDNAHSTHGDSTSAELDSDSVSDEEVDWENTCTDHGTTDDSGDEEPTDDADNESYQDFARHSTDDDSNGRH
ncbi:hypothetical protein AAVH_19583 [Aphelenchoides avenae]|nr:hypothetical protein AAVH_19583 [Aphelenchus avenae]